MCVCVCVYVQSGLLDTGVPQVQVQILHIYMLVFTREHVDQSLSDDEPTGLLTVAAGSDREEM